MARSAPGTGWTALVLALALAAPVAAQNRVTTPVERFGHELGADY